MIGKNLGICNLKEKVIWTNEKVIYWNWMSGLKKGVYVGVEFIGFYKKLKPSKGMEKAKICQK